MTPNKKLKEDIRFDQLRKLYSELKENYQISGPELISSLEEKDLLIPATAFKRELAPLETVVKYLKENLSLDIKTISQLTSRSQKTIWQALASSKKKHPEKLIPKDTELTIPITILAQRELSVLESIVLFLKEQRELGFRQIGELLERDERTIWTVNSRVKKKMSASNTRRHDSKNK